MKRTFLLGAASLAMFIAGAPAGAVVGGGDITMKSKGGAVTFSHDTHVAGVGLDCRECHTKLFIGGKQHRHMTMKEMGKGKYCGACHDGKKAFSVKGNCARCHKK